MRPLINITDVRQFGELSMQKNADNFAARVRNVQDNQLQDLLGDALTFDFFNFLDNDWLSFGGTFTRNSISQITIDGQDVTSWIGNSLKLDDLVFVIVENAVFSASDTVLTTIGYDLPETVTVLERKITNDYIKLLNGTVYNKVSGETVEFRGLRPYLAWNFLSDYLIDGDMKQADAGNVSYIGDMFKSASGGVRSGAKSKYLQNSVIQKNRIIVFLDDNAISFPLWESAVNKENIVNRDFFII